MERVVNFLKEAEIYYLATVEGDQPRVRPFGTAHIFDGKLYLPIFPDRIHINSCPRHRILADIYVQVFQHTPDAAAVRTDQKRLRLKNTDQIKITAFKPLGKLSVHLLYKFVQVQVHKFQFNVSGTDFRCFNKILRQLF